MNEEERDYVSEDVYDVCGENYGIRETYDNVSKDCITTRDMAKILTNLKGNPITLDSIRSFRKRYWEKFFNCSIKKLNKDRTRQQIYYYPKAIKIFQELISDGLENVSFEPNTMIYDTVKVQNHLTGLQLDQKDPVFELLGKMLEVLKIYVSNKSLPDKKAIKQLEDKSSEEKKGDKPSEEKKGDKPKFRDFKEFTKKI